jgi:copper chaperone NosL
MKKKIALGLAALLAVAGLYAEEGINPAAVDEKNDLCATCFMAVKDSGYAAQIVDAQGKALKFDDIGCLFAYISAKPETQIKARFVQDSGTKEWIALEKAVFVALTAKKTPMAYGIHAFADATRAQAFIAANPPPRVVTLADAQTQAQSIQAERAAAKGEKKMKM